MKRLLVLVACFACFVGCKKTHVLSGDRIQRPGAIAVWGSWVKDKGDKYDIQFNMVNDYAARIAIKKSDIQCYRGATRGELKTGLFSGTGPFYLQPGQQKSVQVTCDVPKQPKGANFRLVIEKVYNTAGGGDLVEVIADQIILAAEGDGTPLKLDQGGTVRPGAPPTAVATAQPQSAGAPATAMAVSTGVRGPPARTANPDWVVAVMDVEDVNAESKTKRLEPNLIMNIGNQLRIFLVERGAKTIDKGAQEQAIRDQMSEMKKDSYKACYDDSCQVELGKALAASHILRSKITRFGEQCVLNGELIELKREVVVSASAARGTCKEEGFLVMAEQVAGNLTAKQ